MTIYEKRLSVKQIKEQIPKIIADFEKEGKTELAEEARRVLAFVKANNLPDAQIIRMFDEKADVK